MNRYALIFLIWLLPLYFVFQSGYQIQTYFGLQNTYEDGASYIASVVEFDVKQIAAQTNGYVILRFQTSEGRTVEEQLALPVQFAQVVMESELIPVRYLPESSKPIVMMPIYDLQLKVIRVNIAVTLFGIIVTLLISIYASKFALRRVREGEEELEIERVDQ